MRGYTIVELLIIITILALLVTFGLSSYSKSQDRQTIQQAKEAILANLQTAQKAAYIGDKDCDGALLNITVSISGNAISRQAHCGGGDGTVNTTVLSNLTFLTSPTIIFKPLDQGVGFGSGSSANIDYEIGTATYRVSVSPPGTITYLGAQ